MQCRCVESHSETALYSRELLVNICENKSLIEKYITSICLYFSLLTDPRKEKFFFKKHYFMFHKTIDTNYILTSKNKIDNSLIINRKF